MLIVVFIRVVYEVFNVDNKVCGKYARSKIFTKGRLIISSTFQLKVTIWVVTRGEWGQGKR